VLYVYVFIKIFIQHTIKHQNSLKMVLVTETCSRWILYIKKQNERWMKISINRLYRMHKTVTYLSPLATSSTNMIYIYLNLARLQWKTCYPVIVIILSVAVGHVSIAHKITVSFLLKRHASPKCKVQFKASKWKAALFTQQKRTTKHILHVFSFWCFTVFLHSNYYSSPLNHK
jgi:hypothetical protein